MAGVKRPDGGGVTNYDGWAFVHVRNGSGQVVWYGDFTDTVDKIWRRPRQHAGWQSVTYKGRRYRLAGGGRTVRFICLDNPIKGRK
jgi:hypothetical protein